MDTGTDLNFELQGVDTPMPYETVEGEIKVIFYHDGQIKRIYTLTTPYPTLQVAPFTGTTSLTCDSLDGFMVGKYGKLDCTIAIPFDTLTTPINNIKIDFLNTGNDQIEKIISECQAYEKSSSNGDIYSSKGQFPCSRKNTTLTNPSIRVSDLTFDPDYTVYVNFKASVLISSIFTIELSFEVTYNSVYYTLLTKTGLDLSFSSYISNTSNFFF